MAAHEKKRFVEKVDYISSPGFLTGPGARERYGLAGGGPAAIITTLGILRPAPDTLEFILEAVFPYSSVDEVRANTGWDLKVSDKVGVVEQPSDKELDALRSVDTTGALR